VPTFVALLRAVNVGGTGALRMPELVAICVAAGFSDVRTYIQSGNVVFQSRLSGTRARGVLERALEDALGRKVDVVLRDAEAMRAVVLNNPMPDAPGAKLAVVFSSKPVPKGIGDSVTGRVREQVFPSGNEVYVYYPDGMGRSKLKLPTLPGVVTVRNLNTVAALARMCGP
jgi:uncharacterized protein (DUF1697 family)